MGDPVNLRDPAGLASDEHSPSPGEVLRTTFNVMGLGFLPDWARPSKSPSGADSGPEPSPSVTAPAETSHDEGLALNADADPVLEAPLVVAPPLESPVWAAQKEKIAQVAAIASAATPDYVAVTVSGAPVVSAQFSVTVTRDFDVLVGAGPAVGTKPGASVAFGYIPNACTADDRVGFLEGSAADVSVIAPLGGPVGVGIGAVKSLGQGDGNGPTAWEVQIGTPGASGAVTKTQKLETLWQKLTDRLQ
jgi:hypothetical protein